MPKKYIFEKSTEDKKYNIQEKIMKKLKILKNGIVL